MKTLKQIIKSESVFLNIFTDEKKVFSQFEIEKQEGVKILFAFYEYEDYSGIAFVLFTKDKMLFEVNGSHCSCCGLESQWVVEEVNIKELEQRLTKGTFGEGEFKKELKEFLGL